MAAYLRYLPICSHSFADINGGTLNQEFYKENFNVIKYYQYHIKSKMIQN
jgi:hypothetical protein